VRKSGGRWRVVEQQTAKTVGDIKDPFFTVKGLSHDFTSLVMPVGAEISPPTGILVPIQNRSESEFHRPSEWILIWTGGPCILPDGLG